MFYALTERPTALGRANKHSIRKLTTEKEWLRINPKTKRLDYSRNQGVSWHPQYSGSGCGDFEDITETKDSIVAVTSKGLYLSKKWCQLDKKTIKQ